MVGVVGTGGMGKGRGYQEYTTFPGPHSPDPPSLLSREDIRNIPLIPKLGDLHKMERLVSVASPNPSETGADGCLVTCWAFVYQISGSKFLRFCLGESPRKKK